MENVIPVFPSAILNDNSNAFDWGSCGVACFATGSTLHFFEIAHGDIKRLYSIDFKGAIITVLRFHATKRIMAFGDKQGNLFIWDVDKRGAHSSIYKYFTNTAVLDIQWRNEVAVALFSNNHLLAFTHNPNVKTENLIRVQLHWDLTLKSTYTRVAFDPHQSGKILLSCESPQFSVYQTSKIEVIPKPFFEIVELSNPDKIQDCQWSHHFPGFIYVVVQSEVYFFHIDSKTLIPLARQRATGSSYKTLVQSVKDFRKFLMIHKNGAMTFFTSDNNLNFSISDEILPKHYTSFIVNSVKSPMSDSELLVIFGGLGLCMFDMDSHQNKSSCFTFPTKITAISCDKTHYALGTASGNIIVGSLKDPTEISRYHVSNSILKYVRISYESGLLYFRGPNALGQIDLKTRQVLKFPQRGHDTSNCVSSIKGALVVQREQHVIGVFIQQKERPLLLADDAIDLSLNEEISDESAGSFAVLLKNHEINFYNYDVSTGVTKQSMKFAVRSQMDAICAFAISGQDMVTAFDSGNFLFYNFFTRKSSSLTTPLQNVRGLRFNDDILFGLCKEKTLFAIKKGTVRECPYDVKYFDFMNSEVIFILGCDDIPRFISIFDWRSVSQMSKAFLSPDSIAKMQAEHILHHPFNAIIPKSNISEQYLKTLETSKNIVPTIMQSNDDIDPVSLTKSDDNPFLVKSNLGFDDLISFDDTDQDYSDSLLPLDGPDDEYPPETLPDLPDPEELISKPIEGSNFTLDSLEKFGSYPLWFKPEARAIWLCFMESPPIQYSYLAAIGETGRYENLLDGINRLVSYVTPEFNNVKFQVSLFANHFDEAADFLMKVESGLVVDGYKAGIIIASAEGVSDKLATHLKSVAVNLFLQGDFEEGATILRIARLDRTAVDYLIEYEQYEHAIRFIRSCLNDNDKHDTLLKLASRLYSRGESFIAILMLIACQEYHIVLYIMHEIGMIADAFFLKKYLFHKNMINDVGHDGMKLFPDMPDMLSVGAGIDSDFVSFASSVGVEQKHLMKIL